MSTKDFLEKDFYKILGVAKDAPADEIKKSYRKLARKYHPDANKGNPASEERFKEISEAYNVLSDEKRRKEYDDARSLFGSGGIRMPGSAGGGQGGFDLGDLFGGTPGSTGGRLGDLLGGVFGGRTNQQPRPRRGADIETETSLTFGDAIDGVTVSLRLAGEGPCKTCMGTGAKAGTVPRVCPTCEGSGQASKNLGNFAFSEPCRTCRGRGLVVDDPCEVCSGSGRAMSTRTIQARIPAGVGDGQRIKLKGRRPLRAGAREPGSGIRQVGPQPDGHHARYLSRGCPRRGDQGTGPPHHAGERPHSGGHPERPDFPGSRQGRPAPGRHHGRPAGHRGGGGAEAAERRGTRGAGDVQESNRGHQSEGRPAAPRQGRMRLGRRMT
jgi:DnaJ-class molecular chaperone